MSKEKPIIAGAGLACMDYFVVGPQIEWGDLTFCTDNYSQGGGPCATGMVAAKRCDADVIFYTFVGDDSTGKEIVTELEDEGIECHIPTIEKANSAFSYIYINPENGDRTIFHRPAKKIYDMNELGSYFDYSAIDKADILLIDDFYIHFTLSAAKYAKSKGIPVCADLKPNDINKDLIKYTDILIAPNYYPNELGCPDEPEKALDVMHNMGIRIAVVTRGSKGWIASDGNKIYKGDAFKVKAVDTNGAGDTFHGAFVNAWARGFELDRCCDFASAVAALKCTKTGGRSGIPNYKDTITFLKEKSNMDWTEF